MSRESDIEKQEGADKLVVQHQKLSNLLQAKDWSRAVRLALTLSQPFTALKIIKKLQLNDLEAAGLAAQNTIVHYTLCIHYTMHCT